MLRVPLAEPVAVLAGPTLLPPQRTAQQHQLPAGSVEGDHLNKQLLATIRTEIQAALSTCVGSSGVVSLPPTSSQPPPHHSELLPLDTSQPGSYT